MVPRGYDELYIRWYEYWSPGWVWASTAQKIAILNPAPETGGPNFYVNVMWGNGQLVVAMQYMADSNYEGVNFYQNRGTALTFQSGMWYCIEAQAKLNTPGRADGLFRVWIDDELKLEYVNRALRGPTPTSPSRSTAQWTFLDVASHYGESPPQTQFRWHDDLVISTQRIGCIPGVSDTTPPGSPTGVRINSQ